MFNLQQANAPTVDIERQYQRARQILEGTNEIMRVIVARALIEN